MTKTERIVFGLVCIIPISVGASIVYLLLSAKGGFGFWSTLLVLASLIGGHNLFRSLQQRKMASKAGRYPYTAHVLFSGFGLLLASYCLVQASILRTTDIFRAVSFLKIPFWYIIITLASFLGYGLVIYIARRDRTRAARTHSEESKR